MAVCFLFALLLFEPSASAPVGSDCDPSVVGLTADEEGLCGSIPRLDGTEGQAYGGRVRLDKLLKDAWIAHMGEARQREAPLREFLAKYFGDVDAQRLVERNWKLARLGEKLSERWAETGGGRGDDRGSPTLELETKFLDETANMIEAKLFGDSVKMVCYWGFGALIYTLMVFYPVCVLCILFGIVRCTLVLQGN